MHFHCFSECIPIRPQPCAAFKAHGLSKWTDQLLETPQTTPTDRITVARPKRLGTRATFVLQIGEGGPSTEET